MKVIIVEPHPYHYEVVAGVLEYFYDLGYETTIYVRENFDEKDVLCRYGRNVIVEKYKGDTELKNKMKDVSVSEYDLVFFSSLEYYHEDKKESILKFLGEIPKTKYGFLGIYHNLDIISEDEMKYLKEGRIFTLSEFEYKGIKTSILSAHAFGKISIKKELNDNRKIVLIGLSNRRMLIENAVEKLMSEGEYNGLDIVVIGQLKWYKDFVKRFISNIIYKLCKLCKLKTPYEKCTIRSWKQVKLIGKISFEKMFSLIEECDFIGIILDYEDYQTKAFLKYKTSGSKQLAYGFCKPVIISSQYAKCYGFNENNSIVYEGNDVYDALTKVKYINNNDYYGLVDCLKKDSDELYKKSIYNLRKAIEGIEEL
ncbi:MAG: hypothetical protein Q4F06_03115 [Eubacteriales bacterium]|nr:hypothetical protein [Eubacteriales bacterium]